MLKIRKSTAIGVGITIIAILIAGVFCYVADTRSWAKSPPRSTLEYALPTGMGVAEGAQYVQNLQAVKEGSYENAPSGEWFSQNLEGHDNVFFTHWEDYYDNNLEFFALICQRRVTIPMCLEFNRPLQRQQAYQVYTGTVEIKNGNIVLHYKKAFEHDAGWFVIWIFLALALLMISLLVQMAKDKELKKYGYFEFDLTKKT